MNPEIIRQSDLKIDENKSLLRQTLQNEDFKKKMQAEKEGQGRTSESSTTNLTKSRRLGQAGNFENGKIDAFSATGNQTLKIMTKKGDQSIASQLNQTSTKIIKSTGLAATSLLSNKNLGPGSFDQGDGACGSVKNSKAQGNKRVKIHPR